MVRLDRTFPPKSVGCAFRGFVFLADLMVFSQHKDEDIYKNTFYI